MPKMSKTGFAPNELAIPAGAAADAGAAEILRAWIANQGLHVSLLPAFETPEPWGVLLVDLARHAARAFAAEKTCTEAEALRLIRAMFEAEWERPTDIGTTEPAKQQ